MEFKSSIENFENLTFEIVDEKGHVYRLRYRSLVPNPYSDLMFVYLAGRSAIEKDNQIIYPDDLLPEVDEGFKFEAGKEYKIRVFDSKSSLVVEDGCVFSDESEVGVDPKKIAKCVAHPSRFNRDFYKESFLKFRKANSGGVSIGLNSAGDAAGSKLISGAVSNSSLKLNQENNGVYDAKVEQKLSKS